MLFNSYSFMLFFPAVLLVYFFIPAKMRYAWLLISSYFFYMCWNAKYIMLILLSTTITWLSGILMQNKEKLYKKIIVAVSFSSNLIILAFFKYFDFFLSNINTILSQFHLQLINNPFDIVLPVGISFYTFQALSYTVDVYRGDIEPEKNFAKYALFVSFFPQLVAGPIERSKNLLTQIDNMKNIKVWNYERITYGAGMMLWGFFLKLVVADRVSILVNNVWDNYQARGATALWTAAIFFSIQIYCDFNSYSLIAIGTAKIMGIDLIHNFNTPYFATSIKDFWHRWHISLSSWFRDYLYIPLGGSRCSKKRKYFNLMITFLVSGLWHGASWNYIVWGSLHGIYQIVGECKKELVIKINQYCNVKSSSGSYKLGQIIITFYLTTIAWVFFRCDTIAMATKYIYRMFTKWDLWTISQRKYYTWGLDETEFEIAIIAILILLLVDFVQYTKGKDIIHVLGSQMMWFRWSTYLFFFFMILIFGKYGPDVDTAQFIYFQF